MATPRRIGRRFPDYGWSWPRGGLDQLLKAALLADSDTARTFAAAWLDTHDIDAVDFREHRLLAAVADRFGKTLAGHAAYPRLAGLQKLLWTRSRIAMRAAEPALRALADAGYPVMLLKGAARIALEPAAQRGRVAHDIDVLVRPEHLIGAFDILTQQGWEPATGVSTQYLRTRLPTMRAMNLFGGVSGDLDLHQSPYDWSQADDADDRAIWDRAVPAAFGDVALFAPSPADRIAIAIGHGGLDAHTHSDWLVDCAVAVRQGEVDWDIFCAIAQRRGIAVPAAIALSYLSQEIGVPVPQDALVRIVALADASGLSRYSGLLQAKPRTDFGPLTWLSRGLAKQLRIRRKRAVRERRLPDTFWRAERGSINAKLLHDKPALIASIPAPTERGEMMLDVTVKILAAPVRRRIEIELYTADRHIARLRKRFLLRTAGERVLRFRGPLRVESNDTGFTLESRPGKHLRDQNDPAAIAAYGAVPFQLVAATFTPAR